MTDLECTPNLKNPSDLCKFLTTILEERCKTFEQKFTNIDLRFDNHKFRFETMDKALCKADAELLDRIRREDFNHRIGELEKNVTRIEVAEKEVGQLSKDLGILSHTVDSFKGSIYVLAGAITIFLAALEILLRVFRVG
jgi:hypothetical protein